jgi:hypothetical protein
MRFISTGVTYLPEKKHQREMTNDEAIKHLFHPKIVAHVKAEVAKADGPKVRKKATK